MKAGPSEWLSSRQTFKHRRISGRPLVSCFCGLETPRHSALPTLDMHKCCIYVKHVSSSRFCAGGLISGDFVAHPCLRARLYIHRSPRNKHPRPVSKRFERGRGVRMYVCSPRLKLQTCESESHPKIETAPKDPKYCDGKIEKLSVVSFIRKATCKCLKNTVLC